MFICPNCKEKITYVKTYSEIKQTAEINEEGLLSGFGEIIPIGNVTHCECPDCGEIISGWQE